MRWLILLTVTIGALTTLSLAEACAQADYKAGVAKAIITPEPGLWLAGYAGRNKPAEGKANDLYAKVLALEDSQGTRLVLVTLDVIGLPRDLSEEMYQDIRLKTHLPREAVVFACSHTHCGPVIYGNLSDMYPLPPDQPEKLKKYREFLRQTVVRLVSEALAELKPAQLSRGEGAARFAINRRQHTEKGVIIGQNPQGPVDHSVPVLRVASPDGKLRAIVFGYACHNTTLDFYQYCGDYAGFAQDYLEEKYPGAVALFWTGCGADANPHPRRTLELAQKHGRELADAVAATLSQNLTPLRGHFRAAYGTISLPLDKLPSKEELQAQALSKTYAVQARAKRLLKQLEAQGKLDDHYPHYPVQVWRLGDDLHWIMLGGEVLVDYALRFKKDYSPQRTWVMGYANDVMAYIPSVRVLKEGGYEADSSMIYYGFPTKWSPLIEDLIVREVHALMKQVGKD
ncbi:MAG: neutral/alkaline non-lysosomal ceramidase N-terminal domain-containing protein [Gemmatales bacterium]|nr:neutral/alkaline non-lysosomal ceramidase N-terminal domain-containing protein [Gemmatales bacterium]